MSTKKVLSLMLAVGSLCACSSMEKKSGNFREPSSAEEMTVHLTADKADVSAPVDARYPSDKNLKVIGSDGMLTINCTNSGMDQLVIRNDGTLWVSDYTPNWWAGNNLKCGQVVDNLLAGINAGTVHQIRVSFRRNNGGVIGE